MKDETKEYKVFTDATFPSYLFINQGGDVFVAKKQTKFLSKQRGIYHFSLKDRDGKIRAVSESRVCVAMKLQRGLEEVVYIPKHKTFRKKKDSVLVELIKAKQKLQEEYPNIDIDDYADEAYLRILGGGDKCRPNTRI